MARLDLLDAVNDPGKPGQTGDDRYGFDEVSGRAWVLDGATDVTPLKPFPQFESGAAWYADTLSAWLLNNPPTGSSDRAYWQTAITAMRAAADADSELPVDSLPKEAWPIASGIYCHLHGSAAEFCWMGDCIAFLKTQEGAVQILGNHEVPDAETDEAIRLNALSEAEKWEQLRLQRAAANSGVPHVFGIRPEAAAKVHRQTVPAAPGNQIMLMSDGLYRLVDPYQTHTPAALFDLADTEGLLGLIRALRGEEGEGGAHAEKRVKRSDDACGVWVEVSG